MPVYLVGASHSFFMTRLTCFSGLSSLCSGSVVSSILFIVLCRERYFGFICSTLLDWSFTFVYCPCLCKLLG